MAKILYTYINPTSSKHLERACQIIKDGGIIAYPTDVNWAMGCDPSSKKSLDKILQLKPHHPKQQPFSLICNSISMISEYTKLEHDTYRVLKKILPGPYTVLLERNKTLPKRIHDKRKVVGVRMPQSPLLYDLIHMYGGPIVTTSLSDNIDAMSPNQDPILYGYEVEKYYGHGINLILDLGDALYPSQTTIIDFTSGGCDIVREGIGDTSLLSH